jgi:hypothetical protein
MEELLLDLLEGEFIELEVMDNWQPLQQEELTFWERFWYTGRTGL